MPGLIENLNLAWYPYLASNPGESHLERGRHGFQAEKGAKGQYGQFPRCCAGCSFLGSGPGQLEFWVWKVLWVISAEGALSTPSSGPSVTLQDWCC